MAEGEIFGLVGPDGAGKTTTMRLLCSIMEPTSGDAWVAGCHVVRQAEQIKQQIGYMSQRFGLYPDLTVIENIHFYADIYNEPRKGRGEKIDRLLGFSNLTPFRRRLAGNLSGGMKQKLGLACALIHTPKVLFLDEPTNGVDPVSRRDFWRILSQLLQQNVTIFVSTAYLDEADRCHRVGLLDHGRLLAVGTPAEVKRLMRGTILEIRTEQGAKPWPCSKRSSVTPASAYSATGCTLSRPTPSGCRRRAGIADTSRHHRPRHPSHRALAGRRVRVDADGEGRIIPCWTVARIAREMPCRLPPSAQSSITARFPTTLIC